MLYQPHDTIVSVARQRAERHPSQNYITFLENGDDLERKISYQELDRSACHVASWLIWQGLEKADRVLVILPNSLEFVQVFYGCLYGEFLAVPMSEPSSPKQMQAYLDGFVPTFKTSEPKVIVTTSPLAGFIKTQLPPETQSLFAGVIITTPQEIFESDVSIMDLPVIGVSDIAYLQFTSGSTGRPKGIKLSHSNIMNNMEQARVFGNWEEGKGTALWLPLFHDFGLAAGLMGALYNGGFVALMTPAHFIVQPLCWLRAISRYRCAYSYAPPFAFDVCLKKVTLEQKSELDLSSLVAVVDGAEPVHYEGVREFNDYFADCGLSPTAIRPGFGMAETVIMFSESKGLEGLCVDRHLLESEGQLLLVEESTPVEDKKYLVNLGTHMVDHEIAIRGENNEAMPEGKVGEIMISGPSVCDGYYRNPAATKETFRCRINGKNKNFLATGDLGLLWKDHLYFTGRRKDVIIVRGKNIYPQDIEYAVPVVSEIRPGCVVAFSVERSAGEALVIAMEVKAELLKDMDAFHKNLLNAIDMKVTRLVGQKFKVFPEERLYLKPGTIAKTSSGKIKHAENAKRFRQAEFEGLIARRAPTS
ncbi:fatty acyl-AMP ligase [bacterium]|nr:fatty acyl-AMP ligase [bacterium]